VFSDGVALVRDKAETVEEQIGKLLSAQMNQAIKNRNLEGIINDSNKQLKANKKRQKKVSNLLNPKRQIYRIFLTLFSALLFVMLDKLVKDKDLGFYSHTLSMALLFSSFTMFIIGVLILRQVAWMTINTKHDVAIREREAKAKVNEENIITPIEN
jgi:cation transport ATPase